MADAEGKSFFRKIDWASFWTAAVLSFVVYFFTLGPSVGLEDSGELATAGDSLGVPHPPGYPIWTMLVWCFCRLFDWVTFRGQPTPAYAAALASAVFGALATGITAMLITRSGADMLSDVRRGENKKEGLNHDGLFSWAGGVAGSLAFAFSPVMWSQSVIVEVYSLGALFTMWVFLLTYQWMRSPRNKTIWALAFVFGLGLTNYQVLLLAAIPLAFIIFMHNAALFRDFVLSLVPIGLTALMLQIGAEQSAIPNGMGTAVFRQNPVTGNVEVPNAVLLIAGLSVMLLSVLATLVLDGARAGARPKLAAMAEKISVLRGVPLLAAAVFGAFLMILSTMAGSVEELNAVEFAPLLMPSKYVWMGAVSLLAVSAAACGAFLKRKAGWGDARLYPVYGLLAVAGLAMVLQCASIPVPMMPSGFRGEEFAWALPTLIVFGGIGFLFLIGSLTPGGLFYAVAVAAVQIPVFVLMRRGAMLGLTHPTTWWFAWAIVWNFLNIALIWLCLPNGRTVGPTILFGELGVSFYGYMPIVSDLRNPPMNWGYPRTWEGFKHALTRGQYEKISLQDIFSMTFFRQLGDYFTDVRVQFTLLVAPLGILPFSGWSARIAGRRIRGLYIAVAIFLVCCAFVFGAELMGTEPFMRIDKPLVLTMFLFSLVGFLVIALNQFEEIALASWQDRKTPEGLVRCLLLAGFVAGIVYVVTMVAAKAQTPVNAQPSAGVFAVSGLLAVLLVGGALGGWCLWLRRKLEERYDVRQDIASPLNQQWLIGTMIGFLVMSVLLIALANPTGDLQDYFIQKVKFTSSHAFFCLWIGYGLIFGLVVGLAFLDWITARTQGAFRPLVKPLLAGSVLVVLCVPFVPIWENYMNEHLVFMASAAEQNGHDYGWQFGNYQLRGAQAITEELENEEPLPNPFFPEEMTPDAVFFGGTDPGRFVPTYMIYAAKVRPDVFLITQNALADNTYMSVMRDLYGDQIWIPTPEDSSKAFQVYVEEVQSGKRQANAALQIENGRVQVSGALGVMEINGILCDMIYRHNIPRHDFYVEESYVIPWMYPYLAPHGLIMKINKELTVLKPALVQNDMDFWDWYTRRLIGGKSFRRDLVAQKSFSKLRSAIAGLYANRGLRKESEQAFEEARVLYPVSPEANFRLLQEVLLPQNRLDAAIWILDEYNRRDPNNSRGWDFVKNLKRVKERSHRIRELSGLLSQGKLDANGLMELANCHREVGNNAAAASYYEQVVGVPNLPSDVLCGLAAFLAEQGRGEKAQVALDQVLSRPIESLTPQQLMELTQACGRLGKGEAVHQLLNRYLKLQPNDWGAWCNMAVYYYSAGRIQNGHSALLRALQLGRESALQAVQNNPIVRPHIQTVINLMQQQTLPTLPGLQR